MIRFLSVASGSKGNATIIYDENTLFQIDMGLTFSRLKEGLSYIDKKVEDIEMAFITHEHTDHIKGVRFLLDRDIPVYCSSFTPLEGAECFSDDEVFHLGSFYIYPFPVSHDASNPTNYFIINGDESLGYVTDTGVLSESNLELLKNKTYYIFESNHDKKMLMDSSRPMCLKKRILSDKGHLSNEQSATYMSKLIGPNTKGIYLAHLSEECNSEEVALLTYRKILEENGIDISSITIKCLNQHKMIEGGDL